MDLDQQEINTYFLYDMNSDESNVLLSNSNEMLTDSHSINLSESKCENYRNYGNLLNVKQKKDTNQTIPSEDHGSNIFTSKNFEKNFNCIFTKSKSSNPKDYDYNQEYLYKLNFYEDLIDEVDKKVLVEIEKTDECSLINSSINESFEGKLDKYTRSIYTIAFFTIYYLFISCFDFDVMNIEDISLSNDEIISTIFNKRSQPMLKAVLCNPQPQLYVILAFYLKADSPKSLNVFLYVSQNKNRFDLLSQPYKWKEDNKVKEYFKANKEIDNFLTIEGLESKLKKIKKQNDQSMEFEYDMITIRENLEWIPQDPLNLK